MRKFIFTYYKSWTKRKKEDPRFGLVNKREFYRNGVKLLLVTGTCTIKPF